jgi:hypothetical protein
MARERTAEEKLFLEIVDSCVLREKEHVQKPCEGGLGKGLNRVYTVTTFAGSATKGGTRTPIICSTFEKAKEVVESNMGDIWEYSYMLCVISGFHMDCLYGTPRVKKDNPEPDTCDVESEEYWYKWVGEDTTKGGYVPIEPPFDFCGRGPLG